MKSRSSIPDFDTLVFFGGGSGNSGNSGNSGGSGGSGGSSQADKMLISLRALNFRVWTILSTIMALLGNESDSILLNPF